MAYGDDLASHETPRLSRHAVVVVVGLKVRGGGARNKSGGQF